MKTHSSIQDSLFGVTGHAGVGHIHSHLGFVQDDSAGFAVVAELLKGAYPVETSILSAEANIKTDEVIVRTRGGGTGRATARRGITPYEAELLRRADGLDSVYSQSTAFRVFGRIYGQGVLEVPVAFQASCCLAVMDTFQKAYPKEMVYGREDLTGNIGGFIGARMRIQDVPASVMAVVNASEGGLGPAEDMEGNIMLGEKRRVMERLGLDRLPTIVLESKAYVPAVCKGSGHERFWIRCNGQVDNTEVYDALCVAAESVGLPYLKSDTAYPRNMGEMSAATRALGNRIAEIGKELASEPTAARKVTLVAELAEVVSQDAGGVTFMSNDLHDIVAGGGIMPGTAAVLSMLVSEPYIRDWKIPFFTPQDAENYIRVVHEAATTLFSSADAAQRQLASRFSFRGKDFASRLKD
jgi:hypothetical protein